MTESGRACAVHGLMECPGYKMIEGSAREKLYKRHQELRKKSGLPDPEYYQELKASYDLPDEERLARIKEIKKKYNVNEGGPFSYGAKKPRKGSVADLAAQKRKEQERGKQPAEPKDQRVGVARVVKGVAEGSVTPNVSVNKIYDDGNIKEWHIYRGEEMIGFVVKNLPDTAEGLYIASGYGPGRGFTEEFNGLKSAVKYITSLDNQDVAEGRKPDYNFDIEDIKKLEQVRDLETLKTLALQLISKPSAKPMKPEKVEWFKSALERMDSPLKVIKLMYDLLLSGEGHSVIGSRKSMNPNTYRQRFGEEQVTNEDVEKYLEEMQRAGYEVLHEQSHSCPECGGPAFSDQLLAEKKDACYSKVKSRYKVWPSAYASGALVRCRKVGAKNWGNKSKK